MAKIELLPAWFFICDHCGEDQFLRVVVKEGMRNDEKTLEAFSPARVMCKACKSVFTTGTVNLDCS